VLDSEALKASARKKTGLHDFGKDDIDTPLQVLLTALAEQAQLNEVGAYRVRSSLVSALSSRLQIEDYIRQHAQLLQRPVERPVFIASLPRTGTTVLHHMLNADPRNHTLRLWEGNNPVPPPRDESYDSDARIEKQREAVKLTEQFMPGFRASHLLEAEAPDECHLLFNRTLLSAEMFSLYHIPAYADWVYQQDLTPYYRYHQRQLQLLQQYKSGHWVLKSPFHQLGLDAILTVYPDAIIVLTHRAPMSIVASGCSFNEILRRSGSDVVDKHQVGRDWMAMLTVFTQRFAADRARLEPQYPGQFIDIDYGDFLEDPWPGIEAIYRQRGEPLDDAGRKQMQGWVAQNPPGKHGRHEYHLADYGIDRAQVEALFGDYAAQHRLSME
jgi:hypothetical protein